MELMYDTALTQGTCYVPDQMRLAYMISRPVALSTVFLSPRFGSGRYDLCHDISGCVKQLGAQIGLPIARLERRM